MKDGLKYMRLKFYIEGSEPGLRGTVHSESKEVHLNFSIKMVILVSHRPILYMTNYCFFRQNPETGKYEFRYIFVDIDTYPRRTIVIEDNR